MDTWWQKILALAFTMFCFASQALGAEAPKEAVSAKFKAFAPNAGGQNAYSVAYYTKPYEFSAVMNTSLIAAGLPYFGGFASYRFGLCDESCFWQFYAQTGLGLTSAGPGFEILWGTMIPVIPIWLPMSTPKYIPQLRIDFATDFFFTKERIITWSYPLWVGVGLFF